MARRPRIRTGAAAGAAALALAAGHGLVAAESAAADDSVPTAWMEAAGTTPLLHAPPPPSPATICLIDTGVTPTPDLTIVGRSAADGGTLDDVRASADSPGHGTAVAHMAAGAVNGWGGAGVFPHARITSVRVFPREGGALWQEYIKGLQACHRLAPATTKVVLMSLGGQTIEAAEAQELESAIEKQSVEKDFSVVVAAGNGGAATDFPGRFGASFTVAGSSASGALCSFSARGPGIDLSAPGCGLDQAGWSGSEWLLNGTSFAAPIVGGVIAALRAYRPDLSAKGAESIVLSSARVGTFPILDAAAALRAAGLSHLTASPPSTTGGRGTPAQSAAPASEAATAPLMEPLPLAESARSPRRLAKPRVPRTVRLRSGRVRVSVRGRPRGAATQIRLGGRAILRHTRTTIIPVRGARSLKVRYVTALTRSAWVHVRIVR